MLKVLELFAGIGACSKALERLGIEHEIVDAVEIDKYAITSFNAIHGTNFEVQDITNWDKNIEVDLIMHGSPCQDFSVAGRQAGGDVGSGTRSSLMYETVRIVGKIRPKYVVWENVKNLLSKKHKHNFDAYIETMNILGYNSYYQVLNAKDYSISQNRERVFTISIRKDIDDKSFTFPEKEELKLRLKDMLEEQVDEKYYLSDIGIIYFQKQAEKRGANLADYNDGRMLTVAHGQSVGSNKDLSICPTLDTQFSNRWRGVVLEPKCKQVEKILIKNNTKMCKALRETLETNDIPDGINMIDSYNRNIRNDELSSTITTRINASNNTYLAIKNNTKKGYDEVIEGNSLRIRKLTPKECWRLMGFDDEDFEKARESLNNKFYKGRDKANSQLYKQAGNSIVVNVLERIFNNLLK